MRIIVCVKQVPDTTEVKIDPKTGTLIREGVPSILNPDDANALEEALKMKDKDENVTVSVVSMGPPQADVMLRECLAMGADEAYLVSDRALQALIPGLLQRLLHQQLERLETMILYSQEDKL